MLSIIINSAVILTLAYMSYIDLRYMIVPYKWIAALTALGIIYAAASGEGLAPHLAGMAALGIISVLIALATGGLGGGDVKLFAALGCFYGVSEGIWLMMLSFLTAGIFIISSSVFFIVRNGGINGFNSKKEIAFVPFVFLSAFLIFMENLLYWL